MSNKACITRRGFLGMAGAVPLTAGLSASAAEVDNTSVDRTKIDSARTSQVLRTEKLAEPVIIDEIALMRRDKQFFIRARSVDGVEAWAMTNRRLVADFWPLIVNKIAPFFEGKDARDLDQLVDGIFAHKLNYKLQGVPFWVCVAWVEFAVLDLLGQVAGLPVGNLIGRRTRNRTKIYYANGDRKSSAEAVVDQLQALIDKSGAKAVKMKVGGRLYFDGNTNARDKALIRLSRDRLGDDAVLMADANSSFDYAQAVKTGQLLNDQGFEFFEEPLRFDDYAGTKNVADTLSIPIAGGEQETSMLGFRWLIANRGVDVVQPDILLNGGFIRAVRVARMAAAANMPVVPHMSGFGLGIIHVLHFASAVANIGPYQEFKGDKDGVPYEVIGTGAPLRVEDGDVGIPEGPGLGLKFDRDFLAGFDRVDST